MSATHSMLKHIGAIVLALVGQGCIPGIDPGWRATGDAWDQPAWWKQSPHCKLLIEKPNETELEESLVTGDDFWIQCSITEEDAAAVGMRHTHWTDGECENAPATWCCMNDWSPSELWIHPDIKREDIIHKTEDGQCGCYEKYGGEYDAKGAKLSKVSKGVIACTMRADAYGFGEETFLYTMNKQCLDCVMGETCESDSGCLADPVGKKVCKDSNSTCSRNYGLLNE